jgi:Zinc finger, C3HC4 type (RING finger)
MPPLPLPSSFDSNSSENLPSASSSYPTEASSERIARLRTELQGVRTGIQRIVSGLHDLNETTHQQELAAHASLAPFTMSTRSERSPPRTSRSIFQGNLESSAWAGNVPSPPRFQNPSTARNHPRLDTVRPRPSGQDPMLRVRQRAYLESDQQRQSTTPNAGGDTAARNYHGRLGRENPFQPLGTREDVERPDYQSPVANMYGSAWGEYRNAELARQGRPPGGLNAASSAEARQQMIANPLINPPTLPTYIPTFVPNGSLNGVPAYLNPLGPPGNTTPAMNMNTPLRYSQRESNVGPPPTRWSFQNMTPAASNRRQQNLSAPDRGAGSAESTSSIRRTSDASRRGAYRGESEGGSFGRGLDISSVDVLTARSGYPYTLPPGGIPRDQHPGEYHSRETGSESESEPSLTFDTQDRPPPMDPDSMKVNLACSICREHLVDTVLLPCGHAVMCSWCADLHVPSRKQDKSTPKDRSVKCPLCRTRIKQKVRRPLTKCLPRRDTNGNSSKSFIHEACSSQRVGRGMWCLLCSSRDIAIVSRELAFPAGQAKEDVLGLLAISSSNHCGRLGVAKLAI